ncbi:MAG TPA: MerR family transcriptional regulator [Chitinophagaceae bacterium]|nr:MerR family transcriptional regulator [Chitinophagaceae bacterium]
MQEFSIKDIENLCGIKAHTLRIWEQRYGFLLPKRKESLHRIYENEDLKKLLQVAFLYHSGWKISKIASLTPDGVAEQVYQSEINSLNYKNYITELIIAAIDFDEAAFTNILDKLISKIGFEKCITDICYPYLQRVGLLWMTSNVIPAQEHFSSYLIQHRIIAETEKLPLPKGSWKIVLFGPQGEHHELPLLFIYYLLKKYGWSVIYLGGDIKIDVLKKCVDSDDIRFLFLHLITNFTGWEADGYFENLCRHFPDKNIIATGSVIHGMQRSFTNLSLLKSDKAIYDFIQQKPHLGNT